MRLTDKEYKEMQYNFEKQVEGLECDNCHKTDDVIATVRGYPAPGLVEFIERGGNVKLSGCTRSANGYCQSCEKFIGLCDS